MNLQTGNTWILPVYKNLAENAYLIKLLAAQLTFVTNALDNMNILSSSTRSSKMVRVRGSHSCLEVASKLANVSQLAVKPPSCCDARTLWSTLILAPWAKRSEFTNGKSDKTLNLWTPREHWHSRLHLQKNTPTVNVSLPLHLYQYLAWLKGYPMTNYCRAPRFSLLGS